jgi:hypothetical protein
VADQLLQGPGVERFLERLEADEVVGHQVIEAISLLLIDPARPLRPVALLLALAVLLVVVAARAR